MSSLPNDAIKQLEQSPLLVRYELGIADDVDEEQIGNLHFNFLAHFRRHRERL